MIEIKNLTKRFGSLEAIRNISLSVGPGEILGFLGPNGAGKSTTMKLVTGYLTPSAGRISVCGHDMATDPRRAQALIGYLPEGAPCYEDMSVRSFLEFIAEIRGFRREQRQTKVASVIETMNLDSVLEQRIETLSKGFKRRVGLAQAIIHDPQVLILDEPTDGLDPNQKHQVREMIRGLSQDKIVIISTHILEEVTAVCTRAVIISEGQIVSDCTPTELEERSKYHNAVTIDLAEENDLVKDLKDLDQVDDVEVSNSGLRLTIFSKDKRPIINEISALVYQKGLNLRAMYVEKGRLDQVFRAITAGEA